MKKYLYIIIGVMGLVLGGCQDDTVLSLTGDGQIRAGEPVQFLTYMPSRAMTRAMTQEQFNERMDSFNIVVKDYKFTVEMYEEGVLDGDDQPLVLGSAIYEPDTTMTVTEETSTVNYATDGSLKLTDGQSSLYWPGNAKKYGFRATAGTATLQADQTSEAKLLLQDRLLGYGFEPAWDATNGKPKYDEDNLNYLTAKQWYSENSTLSMAPGYTAAAEWYKKIPLYLKHQRSLVTIKLKAGEGVRREDLAFSNAEHSIETDIYSYSGDAHQVIQPLVSPATVDYGGEDTAVPSTQYTAVVEPYSYLAGAKTKVIAEIRLSGQRFTFYASNDSRFNEYETNVESAVAHMKNYNLKAGQHLVITATLGRESRKILITAYVEDWDETVTASIVDDYGQAGDPIQINTRMELYEFLNDPTRNKAGNVAIIVPNALNLEQRVEKELITGTTDKYENKTYDEPWTTPMPLNCTLNMAGATFRTDHQIFSEISASGNLVNGIISVGDATVDAAVATTNLGTIEHIDVVPKMADGTASTGQANRAGLVITNSGSILGCQSDLPVQGANQLVGGIAASSEYATGSSTMPIIDGCVVNARVDGTGTATGGGIVGKAVGRVTNNTFEYGITIKQDVARFKNVIFDKADDDAHQLRAYGNVWPTTDENQIGTGADAVDNENMTPLADRYTGVIDSQAELAELLGNTWNTAEYIFRLSNDFTVTKYDSSVGADDGWEYGKKGGVGNDTGSGNVFFKLDGNNKTITTDCMLFSNIMNDISNLTIRLGDDMIATPDNAGDDVMAPLAYSVYAPANQTVTVSNVLVKSGGHRIQATTAAGLVIWVYGPGTAVISDCQVKATVMAWVEGVAAEAKIFSGGIVAEAARATITRCVYHNDNGTLYLNTATNYDDEPEAGVTTVSNIFFGGILGGVAPQTQGATELPSVLITDCTSWFNTSNNAQKGAIVGYAVYDNSGLASGMRDGCEGNYWNNSDAVGTSYNSMTDEQVVGRKNAVAPLQDQHFDE